MTEKNLTATADTSTQTEIYYPETDGMPLPDDFHQHSYFLEILTTLKTFFSPRDDVVVGGDIFIYYQEGNPQVWLAPDCFVVFGVGVESFERNNTYLMWDVGKQPDFVMEIGSPSTARSDLGDKRELYARLEIGEYWRFDPTGGDHYGEPLVGERLVDGEYRRVVMELGTDGSVWGHSPALSLDLHWQEGRLRFYDTVRERWLLNMDEAQAATEAAKARREAAETRVAELEAKLRRLRGE